MNNKFITLFICMLFSCFVTNPASAQIITTIAGGNITFKNGDIANKAVIAPISIAPDGSGNLYFISNSLVCKVNSAGIITIVAGGGALPVSDGNMATSGSLSAPSTLAIDPLGNIYFTELGTHKIRKVNSSGLISTIAGNGTKGFGGDNGSATNAILSSPGKIIIDKLGNLFFGDNGNSRIRKINTVGIITTVAGNGVSGFSGDGGNAISAAIKNPAGLAVGASGNLLISGDQRIREVNTSGIINTIAGKGVSGFSGDGGAAVNATLNNPSGIVIDALGNILVADKNNQRIRKIISGNISTFAGTGSIGFYGENGPAINAIFNNPGDIAIDLNGNLLITDGGNYRIREINNSGIIKTIAGNGIGDEGPAATAFISNATAICVDKSGNIYFPDLQRIRKIDKNGIIHTIAGNGIAGFSGDGGLAINAQISSPFGVYADASGNVYFADNGNFRLRKIDTSGIITTVAGTGINTCGGSGGLAKNTAISYVQAIIGDAYGNIMFSDFGCGVIRKVNTSGIISTIAGPGVDGIPGDGGPATSAQIKSPTGLSMDAAGNLYIGDDLYNGVRKINTSGIISTVAGGASGNSGDGGPAISAKFNGVEGVVSDAVGNLYITDAFNHKIRKVNVETGIITLFAGTGVEGYSGDGGQAKLAQFRNPWCIDKDASGNFYVGGSGIIRKISINYAPVTTNTTVKQFMNEPFPTDVNDNEFRRLLTITPTEGENMLAGPTVFKSEFDATVKEYNGKPYVQSHYDISPEVNASTAQATLKLYYLQSEFDAYNTYVTANSLNLPLFPTGGVDNGSIKVTQFHGTGTAPGNYTGSTVLINPTVAWNATNNYWELTFPVSGFSGFYVTTANMGLPLSLLSFNASWQNGNAILNWATTNEINVSHFEVERSTDGNQFSKIGDISASINHSSQSNYSYADKMPMNGTNFYRLKMVDADGKFVHSKIVSLQSGRDNTSFKIFPNPAKDILHVKVSGVDETAFIEIMDMTGRKLITQKVVLNGSVSVSVDINNLPKGTYNLSLKGKTVNKHQKFVKE